jgi:hypothetical protein
MSADHPFNILTPVVVYVPAGGHPATSGIPPRSGIVGRPDGSDLTVVHFEDGPDDRIGIPSLADRVASAYDRMATAFPLSAKVIVPRDVIVAVGVFRPRERLVELTGSDSEARLAGWLADGGRQLDPAELICRIGPSRRPAARSSDRGPIYGGPPPP